MPIIKCKMCGGNLRIEEGSTVCECEYCGTRQTVPSADNEKKLTLFSRAGRLLRGCEFDKAAGVFEAIVADFPEEAEAYWGLVLCKYGIEYVDDPATEKKIPTCHRSSFESVLDDPNFEQACENTDALARRVYRDEARQIEDLRKRIIEVSGKEEPYDVFISYKETDENGDRTLDSVIAQDIYTELTEKGYRVFFSRISLEDKLGTEYEPYIFAALNSAKVMLVVGTDYENFDSVWVKNEWSRFLKMIASDQKKTLIPVFKNMDAYDMPKEFAKLAAQDMGKVGAMQDLVRGVEKLVRKKTAPSPVQQPQQVIVQQSGGPNTVALLKRGQQALEDCNWDKAREFFDRVLDIDAENSDAFFGLFLVGVRCINEENYINKVSTKNSQTEMLKLSPATERIEKIVKQYTVKDYLSENELRALFQYDLGYPSCVKAKQNLAATEKQIFERDRNLTRAIHFAKSTNAEQLQQFKAKLFVELDEIVKSAKNQETAARKSKQQSYEAFLAAVEKKVEEKHLRMLDRLEADQKKQAEEQQKELAEQEEKIQHLTLIRERNKPAQKTIAAGIDYTVGLKLDGTVIAAGNNNAGQCNVSGWKDIVALAAKNRHTVGIKVAGTVVSTGDNSDGQCDVSDWANIVAVATGWFHTIGLKSDGTVVAVGNNRYGQCDVNSWTDIVAVTGGDDYTVGLKDDGTVVAVGNNRYGQCNVNDWKDIVAIASGNSHTVGLKADGRVITVGQNNHGQSSVNDWTDIVAVAAGRSHTIGLKADGTVVSAGLDSFGNCVVSDWSDIVAIAAGSYHTIGVKANGLVVATGKTADGRCETCGWELFNHCNTIDEERRAIESKRQERIDELNTAKAKLQLELANLQGLFTGKRRRKIESDLAKIETELNNPF